MHKFYDRPAFLGENPYLNNTPVLGGIAKEQSTDPAKTGAHYQYTYKGVLVDPYRIFRIYGITDPAIQHAVKKLLRLGRDKESTPTQDVLEAISSLKRFVAMEEEDASVE